MSNATVIKKIQDAIEQLQWVAEDLGPIVSEGDVEELHTQTNFVSELINELEEEGD